MLLTDKIYLFASVVPSREQVCSTDVLETENKRNKRENRRVISKVSNFVPAGMYRIFVAAVAPVFCANYDDSRKRRLKRKFGWFAPGGINRHNGNFKITRYRGIVVIFDASITLNFDICRCKCMNTLLAFEICFPNQILMQTSFHYYSIFARSFRE